MLPMPTKSRLFPALAATMALFFLCLTASAQVVPSVDEVPLAKMCRTLIADPSRTIFLEVFTGHPAPNGMSFTVWATNSDGGVGQVSVVSAQGESQFANEARDSGRPFSFYGSVKPRESGVQCYQLTFDITVHVPAAGYRRLVGTQTVKSAKPMPIK